jgi:L-histidine Nalpha-methyltransferase
MQLSESPKQPDARFAQAVCEGLAAEGQKTLSPEYFYDEIGSALFEVITLLPEYGLARADRRLLARHSRQIAACITAPCSVIELGSGSGTKTAHVLSAVAERQSAVDYFAIEVSQSALDRCRLELSSIARVHAIEAGFLEGLREALAQVPSEHQVLLLFLGSTIGNFERSAATRFLGELRGLLPQRSLLLMGADLVKPAEQLLPAYDDPAGVTAAFNLNLLARINRELGADFNLRRFRHVVRYEPGPQRIEMHLEVLEAHKVRISATGCTVDFALGETIWTESSHKYTMNDLSEMAAAGGFRVVESWVDDEWPFSENLWEAV